MLISGDHLLGRVSLYYDYGYTPDPAGEFLSSLDVVERLGARLCLPGHGRTFTDVQAHIDANRALVGERVGQGLEVVTDRGPITAFDAVPLVYGEPITPLNANWWISETLCYLTHLERPGPGRAGPGRGRGGRSAGPRRDQDQNLDTLVSRFC